MWAEDGTPLTWVMPKSAYQKLKAAICRLEARLKAQREMEEMMAIREETRQEIRKTLDKLEKKLDHLRGLIQHEYELHPFAVSYEPMEWVRTRLRNWIVGDNLQKATAEHDWKYPIILRNLTLAQHVLAVIHEPEFAEYNFRVTCYMQIRDGVFFSANATEDEDPSQVLMEVGYHMNEERKMSRNTTFLHLEPDYYTPKGTVDDPGQ